MNHEDEYLTRVKALLKTEYKPVAASELPKGLSFFSTEQLMVKFSSFVPDGILTKENLYNLMREMGFELAQIKPFSYVWVCTTKTA